MVLGDHQHDDAGTVGDDLERPEQYAVPGTRGRQGHEQRPEEEMLTMIKQQSIKTDDTASDAAQVVAARGLTDEIFVRAIRAVQVVIEEAGLDNTFYLRKLELFEITADTRNACHGGVHHVCHRESYCEDCTRPGGTPCRACGSHLVCELVPCE